MLYLNRTLAPSYGLAATRVQHTQRFGNTQPINPSKLWSEVRPYIQTPLPDASSVFLYSASDTIDRVVKAAGLTTQQLLKMFTPEKMLAVPHDVDARTPGELHVTPVVALAVLATSDNLGLADYRVPRKNIDEIRWACPELMKLVSPSTSQTERQAVIETLRHTTEQGETAENKDVPFMLLELIVNRLAQEPNLYADWVG